MKKILGFVELLVVRQTFTTVHPRLPRRDPFCTHCMVNAVGTEWVTPGLPRMTTVSTSNSFKNQTLFMKAYMYCVIPFNLVSQ